MPVSPRLLLVLAAFVAGLSLPQTTSADSNDRPVLAGSQDPFEIGKCFGSYRRVDYHRDPILDWPCFEYAAPKNVGFGNSSIFAVNCAALNAVFKDAGLQCKIDHPSFESHYAAQAKLTKASARDTKDPGDYCTAIIQVFLGQSGLDANTAGTFN